MGFNTLKVTEPLQGDCLLFTIQSVSPKGFLVYTYLIELRRMKDGVYLRATPAICFIFKQQYSQHCFQQQENLVYLY